MLSAETMAHIEAAGYIDPVTSRIKRKALAQDIVDLCTAPERVVSSDSWEEIVAKALSLDEICQKLFGATDPELRQYVGALTGPRGLVQHTMEDGTVLCSEKVEKRVGDVEGTTRKLACRFVSNDPETIKRTAIAQQRHRAIQAAASLNEVFETSARRVPALAAYRTELASGLVADIQKALPAG